MEAKELFKEAERLLKKDREDIYGNAEENYSRIAIIWSGLVGTYLSPNDVALMMAALKLYRAQTNPEHLDSFVDAIAYVAIAAQASSSSSSS